MIPSNNVNVTILFFGWRLAQLLWVISTIRNWRRVWNYIEIAGTIVFISTGAITRIPLNPITGIDEPINQTAIIEEASQIIFVFLLDIMVYKRRSSKVKEQLKLIEEIYKTRRLYFVYMTILSN